MSNNRWLALVKAFVLFVLSIGVRITSIPDDDGTDDDLASLLRDDGFQEKVIDQGFGSDKVVVVNLDGIIQVLGSVSFLSSVTYDHRLFLNMIENAAADPDVKGVILRVNTPGGGVVESAEIHTALEKIIDQDIPLYVSMANTAASGGYYISAPATKIVAHPATLTGSIGVIMENIDISELAKEYGVDFNTIKSGEFKDIMSPMRKMTDEEEEILQSMVDDLYDDFVQVIVDGRGMPENKVREIGDGRVYIGKQAKEIGLVDELGSLEDTIAMIQTDYDLDDARVVEYQSSLSLTQLFTLSVQNIFQKDRELVNVLNLLRESSGPRILYLYAG